MTPDLARDEMLAVFKAAWDSTGYAAAYPDVPAEPPAAAPWARPTVQHATGGQATLSGANGARRWTNRGILTVQVFAPAGDGMKTAYDLAQRVLVAFRQARGVVWYRNHRLREAGTSGAFSQVNVLVDFTYDETR